MPIACATDLLLVTAEKVTSQAGACGRYLLEMKSSVLSRAGPP
jgi:hypothetical protein